MPDIDPAALSRTDSISNDASKTTPAPIKPPPAPAPSQKSCPRADLEPLYTSLKAVIEDSWGNYKDAVSQFVLGYLSQQEFSRQIEPFISIDPSREHLHNQLLCAILTNTYRDPPEAAVAGWVSANDKPTTGLSKPASGDASEQRLKTEVMQLPPRMRLRIKGVKDDPAKPLTDRMESQESTKRLPTQQQIPSSHSSQPSSSAAAQQPPTSPSTSSGLNKDADVRKRYHLPLFSETSDLPRDPSKLSDRLLPICYEEGLQSGCTNVPTTCQLLGDALETFVKEALGGILGRTRCDVPVSEPVPVEIGAAPPPPPTNGETQPRGAEGKNANAPPAFAITPTSFQPSTPSIFTAGYKARLAHESHLAAKGELKRSEAGLLPVELESLRERRNGGGRTGDISLAWELGDAWLSGMTPWIGDKVKFHGGTGWELGEGEDEEEEEEGEQDVVPSGAGYVGGLGDADSGVSGMDVDGEDGAAARKKKGKEANGSRDVVDGVDADGERLPVDDPMAIDEADWGWLGGSEGDRRGLAALLDDCLAVGE